MRGADGVHSSLRVEQTKLCALVVIGVNDRGEKRLRAIEDGVRESEVSSKKWTPSTYDLRCGGVGLNTYRDSSIRA